MVTVRMASRSNGDLLRRALTVVGMSGETLLDELEVSSVTELKELVTARMRSNTCEPLALTQQRVSENSILAS